MGVTERPQYKKQVCFSSSRLLKIKFFKKYNKNVMRNRNTDMADLGKKSYIINAKTTRFSLDYK